jgi:hypothetical protein
MIYAEDSWLKDEKGRRLLLRGINVGGSTKIPFGLNGGKHLLHDFFNHQQVSFVGRPFPLSEADEHFSRLKHWGFNFLRFLVTWEAIEHEGPGIYDQEYLAYLRAIIAKAAEYDLNVFINPHQDVWSRFTGGDGAPGWTLEKVGFDITKFHETGAAIVQQTLDGPYPKMIWSTNYGKLAAATMFTLFFGGQDFAPKTHIDGVNAQEFLQSHYINAIKQVAIALDGLTNVVGYDTLNEPSPGYIGTDDLNKKAGTLLIKGNSPSIIQGMLLGAGIPQQVEVWKVGLTGTRPADTTVLNEKGISVWQEGVEPIWQQNGVWDEGEMGMYQIMRPNHFCKLNGRDVNFYRDYFLPFANRYAEAIREIDSNALIFVEGVPGGQELIWSEADARQIVYAAHWYDDATLFTKRFVPWFSMNPITNTVLVGKTRIQKSFIERIKKIKDNAANRMNGAPILIGEVGIPFDMHNKKAFSTGDFSRQVKALNATMTALEQNLVSYTLWNYTADNTNEHGDQWNDEDLSIFSRDQQQYPEDINSGGRALEAAIRPHAERIAGKPLRQAFNLKTRIYELQFEVDFNIDAPTEFYVPNYHYPEGYQVETPGGYCTRDPKEQRLYYFPERVDMVHVVRIVPRS